MHSFGFEVLKFAFAIRPPPSTARTFIRRERKRSSNSLSTSLEKSEQTNGRARSKERPNLQCALRLRCCAANCTAKPLVSACGAERCSLGMKRTAQQQTNFIHTSFPPFSVRRNSQRWSMNACLCAAQTRRFRPQLFPPRICELSAPGSPLFSVGISQGAGSPGDSR